MESAEDAARSIAAMQDATKPGGYNVVLSYLQTDKLTDDYTYLLKPNQLREMYSQWETIEYREGYVTAWSKARSLKAVLRILAGRRGYKAARMITCKLK